MAVAAYGGPWRGLGDLELVACASVSWFDEEPLHFELGDRALAEVEAEYYDRNPHADAA